jgi:hypothetical protein
MGLILFVVLIFLGVRGTPIRQAAAYCAITAVVLTIIGFGAMGDATCRAFGCSASLANLAIVFIATFAFAILCFAVGLGLRKLFDRSTA